ncbi:LCP family protein [Nocardioides sp. JQ2195]|uniref:LCP family protein n=1 Tax=Nocardioides sp. JQ2195 TaxID=2592334 RepID=UPI001F0F8B2B|nr:LCP family protein [Nocardioides sp. JQ2195]
MSDNEPSGRHRGQAEQKHRLLSVLGYGILALTLGFALFGVYTYRHLTENLNVLNVDQQLGERPDEADLTTPGKPLNVMIMGSDSREGAGNNIDGLTGGGQRSDTTIVMHLSGDRKFAYGVSLPRDGMVERPTCYDDDMNAIPGGFDMWNSAFAYGGPACTIRQFEQLTGVRINHFVVVDFNGFRDMVDAIDGVEVCIPEDVDDPVGNIHLDAGTRELKGQEALDYVRIRHNISSNGDIGRMKRQQAFVAAMANKVMSKGVLGRPDRLFSFLSAAMKSLTVDQRLGSPKKIADLASEFQHIGTDNIKFITVPWKFYEPDPNRLVWDEPAANELWKKMRYDEPLSKRLTTDVITAENRPGSTASPDADASESPTDDPSADASDTPSPPSTTPSETSDQAEMAAANGLCG